MEKALYILTTIASQVENEDGVVSADDVLNVLRDGAALAALGIIDEDQDDVEKAYFIVFHGLREGYGEAA